MSLRYLLDTNIISDLVRRPQGQVASRIAEVSEDSVCTSIIVAAELRCGAEKSGSKQLSQRVDLLLSALEVLPLEPPTDHRYAKLRHHLTRQGSPIGPNDLLIAAHANSSASRPCALRTGYWSERTASHEAHGRSGKDNHRLRPAVRGFVSGGGGGFDIQVDNRPDVERIR